MTPSRHTKTKMDWINDPLGVANMIKAGLASAEQVQQVDAGFDIRAQILSKRHCL